MRRIVGKSILVAIVMAAPLLYAAPAHAGGAGNCGGSVLGLAGTETCGAYKNDASDVTNPNDLHGFTVSTGGDLVFRNGVGLSGLEHMRLTATGSLGLGTTTPKVSVDFGSNADALLLQTGTTGQRPTATAGMLRYNSTTPAIEAYVSNAWSSLLTSSATITGNVNLGSGAGTASPARSGELGTGIYSDTASTVQIATGATERLRVTATGSVGIGTTSPNFALGIGGDGGILATGTFGSGSSLGVAGAGTRLIWYPKKAAFRAGYANFSYWDDANIGNYSVAMGSGTTASGASSVALGGSLAASGSYSVALGYATNATNDYSMALGESTTATGMASTAMGYSSLARGYVSTAMGYSTTATGDYSTAMGYATTATAYASVAIGRYNAGGGTRGSWVATDPLFEIGNGASAGATSNAFTVLKNGAVAIGSATVNGGASLDMSSRTDSLLLPTGTTGQRPTATAGMVRYNSTTPAIEAYVSNAWTALGGGSSTLGTSAGAASPYKTGEVGTGLFSDTASTVQIATGATERLRVTATGSLGLGTTTPKASVDFSAKTDGLILQTASAAANASCTGYTGAMRYNVNLNFIEYCNGTNWGAFSGVSTNTAAAFSFTNQTDVNLNATISSNAVALSGFTGVIGAVCGTGCTAIARNGIWGGPTALFSNGDTIAIRQTSSSSPSTATTATVMVGNTTSSTWSVTTSTNSPNAFSFTDVTSQNTLTTITSNTATLTGTFSGLTGTCGTGCTGVSRNGGAFAASATGFGTGDTIAIRQITSASGATATTASVTVGGTTSGTWTATTATDPCSPAAPTVGAVCTDGTIYAGISPDTNVKMYTTPCDYGRSGTQGACTGTRSTQKWSAGISVSTGYTSQTTGRANTTAIAALSNADSPYSATQYCENLSTLTYTDWYLPAAGELNVLYTNKTAIGDFSAVSYWSSSEYSGSDARYQDFTNGNASHDAKSFGDYVRCVRR